MANKRTVKPLELTPNQAKFVQYVLQGSTYVEAYVKAYKSEETDMSRLKKSAQRVRIKPQVKRALEVGMATVNTDIVLWNKEKAISKLLIILQKAEADLESKGLTKTNTDTILSTIKELNGIAGTYFKDAKKYEIDLANLEISRLRYELDKNRVSGPEVEDMEDDGFLDAVKAEVKNVWSD